MTCSESIFQVPKLESTKTGFKPSFVTHNAVETTKIILDPVMIAKGGAKLINQQA